MSEHTEIKTHNDIVDNLFEQLAYLDTLPDFNESCTTLYIYEAAKEIETLRQAMQAIHSKIMSAKVGHVNAVPYLLDEALEISSKLISEIEATK